MKINLISLRKVMTKDFAKKKVIYTQLKITRKKKTLVTLIMRLDNSFT